MKQKSIDDMIAEIKSMQDALKRRQDEIALKIGRTVLKQLLDETNNNVSSYKEFTEKYRLKIVEKANVSVADTQSETHSEQSSKKTSVEQATPAVTGAPAQATAGKPAQARTVTSSNGANAPILPKGQVASPLERKVGSSSVSSNVNHGMAHIGQPTNNA